LGRGSINAKDNSPEAENEDTELRFGCARQYNSLRTVNLTQPVRTSMFALLNNRHATFSRWLSLLLVTFILYGTTVEAAHRHGRILPSAPSSSHVDNQQTKNLSSSRTGCSDCLICQLHQHLTTTLIALRLNDPPVQLPQRVAAVVPQELLSEIINPLSGRGPPQAI